MIMDSRNEFADATSIAVSTGTSLIGNVMDLGGTSQDIGNGEDMHLVINVGTAVTSSGAATVKFHLVSDAQAALATDGSATYHYSSGAIAKATLVAGYQVVVVDLPVSTYERYLGVLVEVATAAVSAGTMNAYLTKDPRGWTSIADAISAP